MRHSQLAHFAGKGAASGREAKRKASSSVPPDGGREDEALREHWGAVGAVRRITAGGMSVVAQTFRALRRPRAPTAKIEWIHTPHAQLPTDVGAAAASIGR